MCLEIFIVSLSAQLVNVEGLVTLELHSTNNEYKCIPEFLLNVSFIYILYLMFTYRYPAVNRPATKHLER